MTGVLNGNYWEKIISYLRLMSNVIMTVEWDIVSSNLYRQESIPTELMLQKSVIII
jgi:hypothetical protein